jgi:universal stress protein A
MPIETVVQAIHGFLDAEVMLEQRRTEEGDRTRQCEAFELAKRKLSDAMRDASDDPSEASLVSEAEAYLAATTAFEQVRTFPVDGAEVAGPARRLERAQQGLQEMLNRYARQEADRLTESAPHGKRVLVAVDGSLPSEWAVEAAGQLALDLGASIKLLHVRPFHADLDLERVRMDLDPAESEFRLGEALLQESELRLPRDLESSVVQRWGDAAVEIVGVARRWGADFIVVGTRGRGRVSRFVLGSTAESVVRTAPCPVLTVAHAPAGRTANRAGHVAAFGRATAAVPAAAT